MQSTLIYVKQPFICSGRDYNHQQLNPNNECQFCDIYDKTSRSSSIWSNRPSGLCNDNNNCTIQDVCQNGYCMGTEYSCQTSYSKSSCIQSSECNGDGTCSNVMKINGTICRTAADRCDQPERLDQLRNIHMCIHLNSYIF